MNKEIAKRICEQMTEDIDNLCNCPRKGEKIIDCYGCRELAIKTLLDYINQLETNRDEAIAILEYYLIGNMKYKDSQEQFKRLKTTLERGKE